MIITIRIAEDCGEEGEKKEEIGKKLKKKKGKARFFQKSRNRVDRKGDLWKS